MSLHTILQDVSAADLLRWSAAALLCVVLHTAVYRLYFHPLASHPGPLAARLSGLPSWWHTYRQDRHLWLWRLHKQYGPVVRHSPGAVVINTPDAFRTITGPKGNNAKGLFYRFYPRSPDAESTLQTADNAEHGRKRRVLANAFSERALRGYEPYVRDNLARWCELLEAEVPPGPGVWSENLNMADWMNWLVSFAVCWVMTCNSSSYQLTRTGSFQVFDIMGDLCFGKPFGVKEDGSNLRHIIHLMGSMMAMIYPVRSARQSLVYTDSTQSLWRNTQISRSPILALWVWLKPRGLTWLLESAAPADIREWWAWVADALTERTKAEQKSRLEADDSTARKDFFHYIFQRHDAETGELGYSQAELWEECQLLVTAGADTTAIVLAGVMFYLVRRADAQARLAEEVLGMFDSADDMAPGAALQACSYLRAVINEGLRMTPPVPAELQREVLPGGAVIEGHFFPAGTTVSVSPYALGYNEDVFPKPFEFRPERWVVGEEGPDGEVVSEESVRASERALSAFSAGSRGCIGKNLAWMEMTLVLAKLVYTFEMRRDPSNNLGAGDAVKGRPGRRNPDQYQIYDIFVCLRDGPMVQLKRRVHS